MNKPHLHGSYIPIHKRRLLPPHVRLAAIVILAFGMAGCARTHIDVIQYHTLPRRNNHTFVVNADTFSNRIRRELKQPTLVVPGSAESINLAVESDINIRVFGEPIGNILTGLSLGVIPAWGERSRWEYTYSFHQIVNHHKLDEPLATLRVNERNMEYSGWLFLPLAFNHGATIFNQREFMTTLQRLLNSIPPDRLIIGDFIP